MKHLRKLLYFVKPYWRRSLAALLLLVAVIAVDLSIPRLIQRIIDQGITAGNLHVVLATTALMLSLYWHPRT